MTAPEPRIRSTSTIPLEAQARLAGAEAQVRWLLEEAREMTPDELGLPSEAAKAEVLEAGWEWWQSMADILDHVIATRRAVRD